MKALIVVASIAFAHPQPPPLTVHTASNVIGLELALNEPTADTATLTGCASVARNVVRCSYTPATRTPAGMVFGASRPAYAERVSRRRIVVWDGARRFGFELPS